MRGFRNKCLLWIILLLWINYSCNDNSTPVKQIDPDFLTQIKNTLTVQNLVHKIVQQSNNTLQDVSLVRNVMEDSVCPSVDIRYGEGDQDIDSLILDYGESYCISFDEHQYRGQLIMIFESKDNISVFAEDFCVDQLCFNGMFLWEYGDDENGFSVVTDSLSARDQYGRDYDIVVGFDYLLTSGGDTNDAGDDLFQVSGFLSGVASGGLTFTMTIQEPLVLSGNCSWIIQGIIRYSIEDYPEVFVDYGDGSCDREVLISALDVEVVVDI